MDKQQVEDLFKQSEDVAQLLLTKKVNQKNAFEFKIDYVNQFNEKIQNVEFQENEWQIAGKTVQSSAQIYGFKVDNIKNISDKVRHDVLDLKYTNGRQSNINQELDQVKEKIQKRKKKWDDAIYNLDTYLEPNDKISVQTFDLAFDIDPYFKGVTMQFDEGNARSLLLNNLSLSKELNLPLDESEEGDNINEQSRGSTFYTEEVQNKYLDILKEAQDSLLSKNMDDFIDIKINGSAQQLNYDSVEQFHSHQAQPMDSMMTQRMSFGAEEYNNYLNEYDNIPLEQIQEESVIDDNLLQIPEEHNDSFQFQNAQLEDENEENYQSQPLAKDLYWYEVEINKERQNRFGIGNLPQALAESLQSEWNPLKNIKRKRNDSKGKKNNDKKKKKEFDIFIEKFSSNEFLEQILNMKDDDLIVRDYVPQVEENPLMFMPPSVSEILADTEKYNLMQCGDFEINYFSYSNPYQKQIKKIQSGKSNSSLKNGQLVGGLLVDDNGFSEMENDLGDVENFGIDLQPASSGNHLPELITDTQSQVPYGLTQLPQSQIVTNSDQTFKQLGIDMKKINRVINPKKMKESMWGMMKEKQDGKIGFSEITKSLASSKGDYTASFVVLLHLANEKELDLQPIQDQNNREIEDLEINFNIAH